MLAALIVIVVLGIGLPVLGWLGIRWRTSGGRDPDHDAIDRWLIAEYGLNGATAPKCAKRCWACKTTIWGRCSRSSSGPVSTRLPGAGRAGPGGGGRCPDTSPLAWILLVMAVGYTALGVVNLARGSGQSQTQGVLYTMFGGADIAVVVATVLLAPRRTLRRAERVLAVTSEAGQARSLSDDSPAG